MGEDKVNVKEKDSTATGTDTELEKPELTNFGKFCQRHGINSNLIMLKITLFVMYGGTFQSVLCVLVQCLNKISKMWNGNGDYRPENGRNSLCRRNVTVLVNPFAEFTEISMSYAS